MPWSTARCISISPSGAGAQLRVVAGGDRVEAEPQRPVEDGGELDLLVAAQARVGRAAGGVLVHEVLDHVLVEAVAQVPDVERDADDVGRPAGVVAVLDRAAAAGAGAVRRRVARQRQVDAGDVVAGLDRAGGGDGGVDAAGHGSDDLRHRFAARARSTTGPIASTTRVDVGAGSRCGRARSAASAARPRRRGPSRAARARAGARRPSRPSRSSTRCRGRRAASAASRPRSRGSRGARCRAAGR